MGDDVFKTGERVIVTLRGRKSGERRKGVVVHDNGPLASAMAVKFGPKQRLLVWKQQVERDYSQQEE